MPQLHRHTRDPKHFDLLRVLDEFSRAKGLSINDDFTHIGLINELSAALHKHRTTPIRLYGFRTEAMFTHVAAAIGKCDIIVEEDAGIHYDSNPDSVAPDFRVLTLDGDHFFVEVKNHHKRDPFAKFKLKDSCLQKLLSYADKFKIPLKIAVFWSRLRHLTLVDSSKFFRSDDYHVLPFGEAFARNEMATIGDCMIGTIPPLSLRVYADPNYPREVAMGFAAFTIQRVALMSGETELTSDLDRKIAWYMMLYGKWTDVRQPVSTTDGKVDFIEMAAFPETPSDEQNWEFIGSHSEMVSKQYLEQTSAEGAIQRLSPIAQPDSLGVIIPPDFHGDDLSLFSFVQRPNFSGLPSTENFEGMAH